jgi:predicted enzyme related to lactoylglutathione lyase
MGGRITEVCLDVRDPDRLAQFWSQVLGWQIGERDEDEVVLVPPDGALPVMPTLLLIRVPEDKVVKNRMHLDVNATDSDAAAEVERIVGLGATRVDIGQGDVSWTVLADPEGNEFCVLASTVEPVA